MIEVHSLPTFHVCGWRGKGVGLFDGYFFLNFFFVIFVGFFFCSDDLVVVGGRLLKI